LNVITVLKHRSAIPFIDGQAKLIPADGHFTTIYAISTYHQ